MSGFLMPAMMLGQTAFSIYDSYRQQNDYKRQKAAKSSFYDSEIAPLVGDISSMERPDFDAIRQAEMQNPINEFQNQLEGMNRNREKMNSSSGFNDSGFVNDIFMKEKQSAQNSFESKSFNINRGIQDMQSQFDDMLTQNKLKAKELEYSYKYG